MHIADYMGIDLVVIFGGTSIIKNRPRNSDHIIITKNLDCSPCYKNGKIKCRDRKCLDIPIRRVYEAALQYL